MVATLIIADLAVSLGVSFGKFLLKHYLGEFSQAAVDGFLDFGKDKTKEAIKDARSARRAEIEYEKIGADVVARLESDLQSAVLSMDEPRPDPNKILRRYQKILSSRLAADFVIRNQIDPQKLTDALRNEPVAGMEEFTDADQNLFNDSANRVAQYLFRAASKLPQFDAAREEESVATLAQLAGEVSEVLEDARAIREQVVSCQLTDESDYETSYRNAVVAELDRVELFGVDLPLELKDSRLTDAYVSLRLRPSESYHEEVKSLEPNEEDGPATVSAEEAFDRLRPGAGRLLIRGGAGCGKTTLVRWAAIEAARGTSRERRIIPEFEKVADGEIRLLQPNERDAMAADWRRRMPFVITLRNCPEGKLPSPEQFPGQIGNEVGNPTPRWVQRLLNNGHALVLIDGIDEVSKLNHRDLFASVKRLCEVYPKNYFVLTTRPDAVSEVRFEDLDFVPSEVEPLEDKDREFFVKHWFQAIAQKLKLAAKETQELQKEASDLTRLISHTPWLAQLATTPLYCALTCALYRARRCSLPHGLRAMCETLCEMMVDRRDRERKLALSTFPVAYGQLDYPKKKLLLRRLAHYFVLGGKSVISISDAIEQVGKGLAGMMQHTEREAQVVFDFLLVRSGMLRLAAPATADRPATVEFVHNTFKEFLAGEQLADEANADFLLMQLADETWRRVALFAISAGTAKYQNAMLRGQLEGIPKPLPKEKKKKTMTDIEVANTPRGRAIFAYRCSALGNEWEPDVKDRLNRLTEELFPPRTVAEAEWLASAGNVVIPLLSINLSENGYIVGACVRALRLIGTPEAIEALQNFKKDGRANVMAELCKVFPVHELAGIEWYLQRGFALPVAIGRVVTDLTPLQHLLNHLETLNLRNTQVSDVKPLEHLTQLQSLDLRDTQVSDVTPLLHLTQLQSLNLSFTGVSDVTPLHHMTRLKSLMLIRTQVCDVMPLHHLTQLQSLDLRDTKVSEVTALQHLTQLKSLLLMRTGVSDLRPLQHLTQLQTLDLERTQISDVTALEHLTQLQWLDLRNTQISDVTPLRHLTQLKSLYLMATQVSDPSPLENFTELQELSLFDTKVSDLRPLQRLTKLRWLDLSGTSISDVTALQHLTQLRWLDLRHTQISDVSPLQELVEKGLDIFT